METPFLLKFARPLLFLSIAVFSGCIKKPAIAPIITTPDYDKGFSFLNRQNDSAYYYFNKVVNSSKDSLQVAMAYNNMAICQSNAGDYYGSQESLLTSLRYLHEEKERDQWCLVANYNELGTDNLNLKNYDAAITYYDRAATLAKDEVSKAIASNNKALAFEKKGQYARAIPIYESIIVQSKNRKREYPRVLTNLAMARWRQDSGYRAAPDLLAALEIRKAEHDDWGLNSSYSHLADYYASSRPDSALGYAREMYAVAGRLESPDDEVEALRKLILLGPPKDVKSYFVRYQHLQDSLETARNSAKNRFALIRYEAEKNKADNLRLQRENAERKAELIQEQALIAAIIIVFAVSVVWSISWYRKRKEKMEWEKERAKEAGRFQLSQRVHDVVANGIYRVANRVENWSSIDQEWVADQLWDLYEKSRDISYEPVSNIESDFHLIVSGILTPYGTAERKILITGNEDSVWAGVGRKVKEQLEPILHELMINMDKHSGAKNVVVRFEREGNGLAIQYKDDGVGLPPVFWPGKGLTSTENRIAAIGGRIIFDLNSTTGVMIRIHIPNVDPS